MKRTEGKGKIGERGEGEEVGGLELEEARRFTRWARFERGQEKVRLMGGGREFVKVNER